MRTEERPFRLRPHTVRRVRHSDEVRVWSAAFKRVLHVVRMSSRRSGKAAGAGASAPAYHQRCAVRVTYSANKGAGQWGAHGRYLARESATENQHGKAVGFGAGAESVDIARSLERWQKAGDERMFKLIVSPEFGERMDLKVHTRALMDLMERDLGTKLEWVAAVHHNTEHSSRYGRAPLSRQVG